MASKRMPMSKKTRFEVFKRDKFTCQYCGARAPDVLLQIDHVNPVASGGENDILNLITSCPPCNGGKGARHLDDDAMVTKQLRQLDELQERREQIDLLLDWKNGLVDLDTEAASKLAPMWTKLVPGSEVNERGLHSLKQLIVKYGIGRVADAIAASSRQYVTLDGDGLATPESAAKAWDYVGRIARMTKAMEAKPYLRELFYVRAIARNRFNYFDDRAALDLLERAHVAGAPIDQLKDIAREETSWSGWRCAMNHLISDIDTGPENR